MEPEKIERFARSAADFATEAASKRPDVQASSLLFAWLAGVNYLVDEGSGATDLSGIEPRIVLDSYAARERVPKKDGDWAADTYWQALDLGNSIFAEPDYLDWFGMEITSCEIDVAVLKQLKKVAHYIWGGKTAADIDQCVGLGNSKANYKCSGVVVAERAVLTVKHCAKYKNVYTVSLFGDEEHGIKCAKAVGGRAVLLLTEAPILNKDETAVTPAPIATTEQILATKNFVVCGLGETGPKKLALSSRKRKVPMRAISHDCSADFKGKYDCLDGEMVLGSPKKMPQSGICHGDSGGPGFLEDERCLAVITRAVAGQQPSSCGASNSVRVDLLREKIDEKLKAWGLKPTSQC